MAVALAALFVLRTAAVPAPCASVPANVTEEVALVAAANGLERLVAGDPEAAITCLELAQAGLPTSSTILRDLALAYHAADRTGDALRELDRARALGDLDPEATELRAALLARLGEDDAAIEAGRDAGTWLGALLAASLGDGDAAYRLAELTGEDTRRGALTTLVLAARAGARGDVTTAKLLIGSGLALTAVSGEADAENAARAFEAEVDRASAVAATARVRATVDHASNPALQPDAPPLDRSGLRFAVVAESAIEAPIGAAKLDAALRLDQHVYVTETSTYRDQDLTGLTLAAAVELPISRHPNGARIGVRARYIDVFADAFRVHWASTIEGGPTLALPIASRLEVELGIFGLATDFIDRSPANARISSQNRDLLGRRATLALTYAGDWFTSRTELMFLRDDATGDAFDARGGAIATRLMAELFGGARLSAGVGATFRDWGPVGDQAIIGSAATRPELRTVVELAAEVPLSSSFAFVASDTMIRSDARRLHGYTDNVLSVGVEQRW